MGVCTSQQYNQVKFKIIAFLDNLILDDFLKKIKALLFNKIIPFN